MWLWLAATERENRAKEDSLERKEKEKEKILLFVENVRT
jgi:hypothetical protein